MLHTNSINSTVATLLKGTAPILHLNSNLIPLNTFTLNSTSIKDGSLLYYNNNNSTYWNNTVYPYCPTCYITVATVDPPTYSDTFGYIYYVLLLLLLIVAIICIQIGISRRKVVERHGVAQRRRVRQHAAAPYTTTCNSNNNSSDNNDSTAPKDSDLPPAYDEVVQSYMMAKLQRSQEINVNNEASSGAVCTNISTCNLSTAVSTLTIETDILNSNNASAANFNHALTSETSNLSLSKEPTLHDHRTEMCTTKQNNDHIV